MTELEALAEELETSVHPHAVITRPVRGWQMPCRWSSCGRETAIVVNGLQLCEEHGARRLGRLLWDLRIGALVDLIRSGGFELLHDHEAFEEQAS